jgi:hypothetical protein
MPMHLRFRLAGIGLVLGGLMAGICHLFDFESSIALSQLVLYTRHTESVHVVLFTSGILVLLAWFELYSLQRGDLGLMWSVAFVCLFLGILCGDLLHCILEFSVFPVLCSIVPYALQGIAEETYHATALASFILAGQYFMFIGSSAAAVSIYRSQMLPWPAGLLALSAALLGLGLLPQSAATVRLASVPALYISLAVLGVSVLSSTRANLLRGRG